MGRKYHILLLIMGILVISASTGCFSTDMVTEDFSGDYDANENTTLKVTNSNGDITIMVWDGEKVKLEGEKRVSENRKDELDTVEINVTEENDEIVITTIYHDEDKKHVTVNMEIMVPEYVKVESVKSSNGDIKIIDTLGDTFAESSNGDVTIKDVDGYVNAHSSNGDLDIRGTTGISDMSTSNGDIYVEILDIQGDVSISSSNGKVVAYILPTLECTIDMDTSNGDVSVSGITLDTTVDEDNHIKGTLNGGGHKIELQSSNGDVELKKLDA
jgi:hypothetical protein